MKNAKRSVTNIPKHNHWSVFVLIQYSLLFQKLQQKFRNAKNLKIKEESNSMFNR